MLQLGYRGAVERPLQAIFVHLSAAHLAQNLGLEQIYAPSFEGQVDQGCFPGSGGDNQAIS